MFVWYIVAAVALVLFGGVFSGLTLGLMGLDTVSSSLPAGLTLVADPRSTSRC